MPLTETVFVRVCPTDPDFSTPTCFWQEVPSSNLTANSATPEQLTDLTNAVLYLIAIVFIVAMLKKAIEM